MSHEVNDRRGADSEPPSGPPPDRDPFGRWIMTLMAGLVAAGVAGLWQLSTSVARLDERLGNWIAVSEQRLDVIERGHQMSPPQADWGQ